MLTARRGRREGMLLIPVATEKGADMTIKAIETEADLIAALSEKGRVLVAEADDEGELYYMLRETPDGTYDNSKLVSYVEPELGDKWTDAHDHTSPEYGPWCSTWVLPGFWPWPID